MENQKTNIVSELHQKLIEDYVGGQSSTEVSQKYGVSLATATRILKKSGVTRSRSEAQKLALEQGKSINPTKGVGHSQETKDLLSEGGAHRWGRLSEPERQVFKDRAVQKWKDMQPEKKKEMQSKAGAALQLTTIEGSAAEKVVKKALIDAGYIVRSHVKNYLNGGYEIDLLLPELAIVIELDGPQHFLPIWGEDRLSKTKYYDNMKNGVLMGMGLTIVRVKYIVKNLTEKIKRDLSNQIKVVVANVANKKITEKLVEIEFNQTVVE